MCDYVNMGHLEMYNPFPRGNYTGFTFKTQGVEGSYRYLSLTYINNVLQ